ncbi:conserved hypothetical protein [Leishmania mexicana MHOM/GT/2001/U1103]|uniref:Uncharacterized protein n=1 Tax=Leishmania mexicana (strain MHOM/GT/2001/U1103) TaxID=929439 RepID=E9B1P9_LEIMU|nr:conserved hypothetical protein [Leishmania mexicana MHOM/GT/2001/U1103]CBZ29156.1 conserved hypothetical protein [Leishmania mexicana MHOM/GT/2001/U1103]
MGFFTMLSGGVVKAVEGKGAQAHRERRRRTVSSTQADGDRSPPKVVLCTQIQRVSAMNAQCKEEPKRSRLHSVAAPAKRGQLSLWSRLLCRPEVYDPYVEAAPLTHLLDVNEPHVVVGDVEQADGQSQEHAAGCTGSEGDVPQGRYSVRASSGEGRCARTPLSKDDHEHLDDPEDSVMSCCMVNTSSDVEEFEDEEVQSDVAESNAGEALLHPPVFHVFDTRRCQVRTPTLLWSPTLGDNFSVTAPLAGCSSAPLTETTESGAASSRGSGPSTERRLISREELTKKRLQRRQQLKETAKRNREYKEAWAVLVASAGPHASSCETDETCRQADVHNAKERGSPSTAAATAAATPAVVSSCLTNEALESLREGTQPLSYDLPETLLARLGHYTQLPKKVKGGAEEAAALAEDNDRSVSCSSRSSNGSSQIVLDDEHVSVETGLPLMYGSILRCRDSASKARDVSGEAAASRTDRKATAVRGGSQHIPAGKYLLGSRAYVERVLFAQRRQQECALFALITEAHRQAREAHRRLAQLYYYYIIPILAQYSTKDEIRGLERSVLQCGSGALRLYHSEFCRTVVYNRSELQSSASGGTSDSVACYFQVQPVDYQLAEYRFENVWRELFTDVKAYLGMQACDDDGFSTLPTLSELEDGAVASGGTTSAVHGSVCVAATVLHSMELFERQRHTHSAARDAEEWLAWYYYYFTPHLQRADSAEERAVIQRSLLPSPPSPSSTSVGQTEPTYGDGCWQIHGNDPEPLQPHPLENEYLPLRWALACNTAQREKVLNYRRGLKLRAIEKPSKQRSVAVGDSAAARAVDCIGTSSGTESAPATTVNTVKATRETDGANVMTASSECHLLKHVPESVDLVGSAHKMAASCLLGKDVETDVEDASLRKPSVHPFSDGLMRRRNHGAAEVGGVDSEDTEDDDGAIPVGTHHTVNVGCFGLSFFSIFD